MTQHRSLPIQHPGTCSPTPALATTPRERRVPEFGRVLVLSHPRDGRGCGHNVEQRGPQGTTTPADRTAIAAALYRPLGLQSNPFSPMRPNDAISPAIAQAAQDLADWASRAESAGTLAIVTGASRSGRTTLVRSAMNALTTLGPEMRVRDVVWDAPLTAGGLLRAIVAAITTPATADAPVGRTTLAMIGHIRDVVAESPVVLVLDGASALGGAHLDVVRSLLYGETSLRIIITGSPELVNRIRRRQSLADRVSHHHAIAPLDANALASWLQHRIATVAIDAHAHDVVRITPEAIAIITDWSAGSIGPAIELASECLLESIARGQRIVDDGIAHDIVREFTDRARLAARHDAEASAIVPVIQAPLDLVSASPARSAQTEVRR